MSREKAEFCTRDPTGRLTDAPLHGSILAAGDARFEADPDIRRERDDWLQRRGFTAAEIERLYDRQRKPLRRPT